MPPIQGTVVVTGGNRGIGLEVRFASGAAGLPDRPSDPGRQIAISSACFALSYQQRVVFTKRQTQVDAMCSGLRILQPFNLVASAPGYLLPARLPTRLLASYKVQLLGYSFGY